MSFKCWFITEASSGFGRDWAEAALKRGDKVAATARNLNDIDDLVCRYEDSVLPIELDVTDHAADVAALQRTNEHFGRLDGVINNAGYGLFGGCEQVSEQEAIRQVETNLFGALWITQAALPIMWAQGSGHILLVSGARNILTKPIRNVYHVSRWALEGLSNRLAQEVAGYGIRVTLIEPEAYTINWEHLVN